MPKRSSPQGAQLGAVPASWGHSETLRGDTLPQPPASGLREAASVYTCHEGRREKEEAGAEPQTSPPRPGGNPGGAQLGQVDAKGQGGPRRPGWHGWLSSAELGMPSAGPPLRALPAAFRSRRGEQSPHRSSQARSRADAGRCSRPGPPGRQAPPQPPGARRRHSPGSSRTVAMGMARRPGEELAPRGRTGCSDAERARAEGELLPALSAQRRHGRPPGVSALPRDPHPTTLRPLPPPPPPPPPPPRRPPPTPHTLPSCSGEPLPLLRHFRAQVARSGPGAGGCRGGGGHSGGISVTEFGLLRRRRREERRSPFWVRADCLFLYSLVALKCGLRTRSLLARPSRGAPGDGPELRSARLFSRCAREQVKSRLGIKLQTCGN